MTSVKTDFSNWACPNAWRAAAFCEVWSPGSPLEQNTMLTGIKILSWLKFHFCSVINGKDQNLPMLAESIYYTDQFLFGCAQVQDSEDDSSLMALVCPGRYMSVISYSDLPSPCVMPSPVKRKWLQTLHYCAGTKLHWSSWGSGDSCSLTRTVMESSSFIPHPLSYLWFLGKDKIRLLQIS